MKSAANVRRGRRDGVYAGIAQAFTSLRPSQPAPARVRRVVGSQATDALARAQDSKVVADRVQRHWAEIA